MISYNFRKIFTTMSSSDDDDNWELDNSSSDSKRKRSENSKHETRKKHKTKIQQQTSNFKDSKRKRTKNSKHDSRKKQKTTTSPKPPDSKLTHQGAYQTDFCWPTRRQWYAAVEAAKDSSNYTLRRKIGEVMKHLGLPWEVQHVPIKFLSEEQVEAGQMQKTLSDFKPYAVNNGAVLLVIPGDGPTLKEAAYNDPRQLTVSHKILKKNDGGKLLTPIENIKLTQETLQEFLDTRGGACETNFLTALKEGDVDSVAIESETISKENQYDPHNFQWDMLEENGVLEATGIVMDGISQPTSYHSSANSCFPAHQEEGCFLSVNVSIHPRRRADDDDNDDVVFKVFFLVQEKAYLDLMRKQSEKMEDCNVFWRHKEDFPNLELILKSGIEVKIALQFPGSILFSSGVHWGFNTGLPTAESKSFL